MILVIGENSFLGRSFCDYLDGKLDYSLIPFPFDKNILRNINFDVLINFSFNRRFLFSKYSREADIDAELKSIADARNAHYIMLSSRMVYSPSNQWNCSENSPRISRNFYSYAKIKIEDGLLSGRLDNLTILRIGNVVCKNPVYRNDKPRLISFLLGQLLTDKKIYLDINKSTRKDFISINYLNLIIYKILFKNKIGIFNLGSGQSVSIETLSKWLISGFGYGTLISNELVVQDEFQLDCKKLENTLKIKHNIAELEEYTKMIGKNLARL